jgi:crotonobetainyl-CoA:carnitine CoA-transferase CaiB-like acyl-CoA transferase
LLARDKHGIGQHVDVSLMEAALILQKSSVTRFLNSGMLPEKTGSRAPYATPNEAYRTKDGHIMIAAYHPARWKSLCCDILGKPELAADPRFNERKVRQENRRELKNIIESVFREKTSAEWLALCEAHDIICGPINTYTELVELDQVKARRSIDTVTFPDGRTLKTVGVAPKLSETPGAVRTPYPSMIGEHTLEILEKVGLSQDEIHKLEESGAIGVHRAAG